MSFISTLLERIEAHIISPMTDDDCWITDLGTVRDYPVIHNGSRYGDPPRKQYRLLRIVWEAHNAEPIPEGMCVLHSCDNKACVNPNHLSIGTHAENMRQCGARGRQPGGTSAGAAKRKRDDKGRFI